MLWKIATVRALLFVYYVQVLSFDQVVELGAESSFTDEPPVPDHLALVMYTSGTTGKPKVKFFGIQLFGQ